MPNTTPSKKAYRTPQLSLCGTVEKLTQGRKKPKSPGGPPAVPHKPSCAAPSAFDDDDD